MSSKKSSELTLKRKIISQNSSVKKKLKTSISHSSEKTNVTKKPSTSVKLEDIKTKKHEIATKAKSTLDDLFGGVSAAKKAKELKAKEDAKAAAALEAEEKTKQNKADAEISDDEMGFSRSTSTKQRKKTEEGWNIYSPKELQAPDDDDREDTPLCPFDCKCCFY